MTKMQFPNFSELSGTELIDQFNAMLALPQAKLLPERRYREVSRFSDRETGIKRCEALASSLRAVAAEPEITAEEPKAQPQDKAPRVKKPKAERSEVPAGMSRGDSKRQRAIDCLLAAKGSSVALDVIIGHVYGPGASIDEFKGPISMVLNGIKVANIAKEGLPYRLVRTKNEQKEIFFALEKLTTSD